MYFPTGNQIQGATLGVVQFLDDITQKQKPTNCLSVFDHFVELALKGLKVYQTSVDGAFL